jgi:hypothetical protein
MNNQYVYTVSISATKNDTTEHYPLLLSGNSVEEASESASDFCKDFWPTEDGWRDHKATLVTLSSENAAEIFFDIREGLVDLATDPAEYRYAY